MQEAADVEKHRVAGLACLCPHQSFAAPSQVSGSSPAACWSLSISWERRETTSRHDHVSAQLSVTVSTQRSGTQGKPRPAGCELRAGGHKRPGLRKDV